MSELEDIANANTKIRTFAPSTQLPGLTVGKMVHFVENQPERTHYAAIVIGVHQLSAIVAPGTVDLAVFGKTGHFYQKDVTFEGTPPMNDDGNPKRHTKRTWHWIEHTL